MSDGASAATTHRAIEAVWRIESARLIGGLARMTRDLGAAEELAQDALLTALETWPRTGVPANPGAWLTTTARNRLIDAARRRETLERKQEEIAREVELAPDPALAELDEAMNEIHDDLLRLLFTACHPVLPHEARVALTLRVAGGLSTEEIARAFLVRESTIAQRIVRAKRTLAAEGVAFEVPGRAELPARLGAVLEVVYLIFNEGYAATAGEDWMRPALMEDALRLGRMLAALVPGDPEVHGLVALMELQASRVRARSGPGGAPVLLLEQDRGRWDQVLIRRGLEALARAEELGEALGPYGLQAAIAAGHARARRAEDTDWAGIAGVYDELAERFGSPVVELNRAVAHGMAFGPAAGLALADALAGEPALDGYPALPLVRGEMLERLGRLAEARAAFAEAAGLTQNERERALLRARAEA